MIKELLICVCLIGICSSAAITKIQPELKSNVAENAVEEVNDSQATDLQTAEYRRHGFGYGGYGGYGGFHRGFGGFGYPRFGYGYRGYRGRFYGRK